MLQINYIGTGTGATIPDWPQNGTIEGLLDALSRWELDSRLDYSDDPRFPAHEDRKPFRGPTLRAAGREWCGEINDYRYLDGAPIYPDQPTAVQYVGNFVGYSFAFNIVTDDRELVARLDQAIAMNFARFRSTDLDRKPDKASGDLRLFREKHWAYFASTDRVAPNGTVIPRQRNEALDREANRLYQIAVEAQRLAVQAEYSAVQAVEQGDAGQDTAAAAHRPRGG